MYQMKMASEESMRKIDLASIIRRKPNWIGYIIRKDRLLYDIIKGKFKCLGRRELQLINDTELLKEEQLGEDASKICRSTQ